MYLEDTLRKVLHWLIYRMAAWNNLDIGRIIVYRNKREKPHIRDFGVPNFFNF
jgi:hypothetical protein